MPRLSARRRTLARTFLGAADRYWRTVFPLVRAELRDWRRRAWGIPDSQLRDVALAVQRSKLSNIEGAAAFAAFAPGIHGGLVVRAQVCFQAIYDYVDSLAETQQLAPVLNGRQLHLALVRAVDPGHAAIDHYAHSERSEDGGYVQALVECCRAAFETLPSRRPVAADTLGFARRIVAYQSLNLGERQGGQRGLARWARRQATGSGLRWWEIAASAGSSLGVFALIALAAHVPVEQAEANAVGSAYFPWIGSLHSLLDSLVDHAEDLASGQGNLVAHYRGQAEASARLAAIATEASRRAQALPRGAWHTVVLAGMVCSYLSQREAQAPHARPVAGEVLRALGGIALPAMAVFRLRRLTTATRMTYTMPFIS